MPKLITFKAPATDKGKIVTVEKRGYVCLLYVGNYQEKFVLQVCDMIQGRAVQARVEFLTHYASGMKIGNLNPVKIRDMCSRGSYSRMTDRDAAKQLLADLVAAHGADTIRAKFKAATVYN